MCHLIIEEYDLQDNDMQNFISLGLMAKYREVSKVFTIKVNVKLVAPGWGQFWPQGYNMDTLRKGLVDHATCKIW